MQMFFSCFFVAFSQTLFAETKFDHVKAAHDRESKAKTESLCTDNERVVFTCTIKQKVASVCASNDFSNISGYMQYRFGEIGSPEILIPKKHKLSQSDIAFNFNTTGHGGYASYIRFSQRSYKYYIYDASAVTGPDPKTGLRSLEEHSGVYVTKNQNVVFSQECNSPAFDNELFYDVGGESFWGNAIPKLNEDDINPFDIAFPYKP